MTVRTRHVLFIDGFEPRGPSRLHAVCREAAVARSALDGVRVDVGARRRLDDWRDAWSLTWHPAGGGAPVQAVFEMLRWDDVVRANGLRAGAPAWQRLGRLAADLGLTWSAYLASGVARRMRQRQRGTWVLMWYPTLVALAVLGLVLALVAAWAAALGVVVGLMAGSAPGWAVAVTLAVAAVLTVGAVMLWRSDRRRLLAATWLCRLLGFTALQARGDVLAVDERIVRMAGRIAQVLRDADLADEVLVVGYSTGTILAALAVDAARRQAPAAPAPALLTLGHCLPILSFLRPASACREALGRLAGDAGLVWLDISAPGDVAAFGDVPPWGDAAVAGVKRMRSPRWHRLLPAAQYAALRADREALHRQYLRGPVRPPLPGEYDFMALLSGPMTLREQTGAVR